MNYNNIPQELKETAQWVCWQGASKIPMNPKTGGKAQSNNKSTWGTFEQALRACVTYHFDGIGFMFAPPYFGVDLDKCLDDTDFVDEFVETLQSYNEISRSGNGIHIICKGELPDGAKRSGRVEMYQNGRYFITTGNIYNSAYASIIDCTETIKLLRAKYLPETTPAIAPKTFTPLDLDDSEIIEKARNCKTGYAFQNLYAGMWEGNYPSQSEAEMAFCNYLAFWTQKNKSQMDRIFRNSGLYRSKWDRRQNGTTYGDITLEKAIASCKEVYEPTVAKNDTDIALKFFGKENAVEVITEKKTYDMTDTGNARRFYDKYKGNVRYSYNRKKWLYWTGKKWQIDEVGAIKNLADGVLQDLKMEAINCDDEKEQKEKFRFCTRTANTNGKEAMIKEAQHLEEIPVLLSELDGFQSYLNCQNGIINLRNGELIPHESSFGMTKICNAEYDIDGKEPKRWLQFLDEVTNGDKDLQRYLQKCVGYSLTGLTTEQCAFFLYGMGNNGKSTFIDTIINMLGDYAANAQPDTLMLKKQDNGINSDIARLKGSRCVSCAEPTEGVRLNEGLIKQLTGGDKITCRFLFGDEFEYEPEFKIWIATNHRPVIRGTDVGIWRRIRLIPFTVCIPPEKVDKSLKYKLSAEMPQILAWAVKGCILWQKEGLGLPQSVAQATAEYKNEMDLLEAFVEACLVITNAKDECISTADLYSLYREWAKGNNEYEMTSRKFNTEIMKKLPEKKRLNGAIAFTGVKLSNDGKKFIKSYSSDMFC